MGCHLKNRWEFETEMKEQKEVNRDQSREIWEGGGEGRRGVRVGAGRAGKVRSAQVERD